MYPQRVLMILMILACWVCIHGARSARLIDCEVYVFHPQCRGSQARKRVVDDNEKPTELCTCKTFMRHGRRELSKNIKLLEAMLSNGIDINAIYDAYSTVLSSSKNNNEQSRETKRADQRTMRLPSLGSAIDFSNSDTDVDY